MREVQASPLRDGEAMDFTVVRVPFFLEPDYPHGEEFEETNRVRLVRKWGGNAGWEAQKHRHGLKQRGQAVGIEKFNLDRVASNTMASHRLVQWITRTLGINKAEALYADLNSKHFEHGIKLNDREMLVEAASAVGAEPEAARAFLASDEGLAEIQAASAKLSTMGISGIPTLILGGEYQLQSGAVGSETLVQAFRTIEEQGGATGSLFAEALRIPDHVMKEAIVL